MILAFRIKQIVPILITMLFQAFVMSAQVQHLGRFEIPFGWEVEDFHIVPNGTQGVVVLTEERLPANNQAMIKVFQLDELIRPAWSDSLLLNEPFVIEGYDVFAERTLVLLTDEGGIGKFKFVAIDTKARSMASYDAPLIKNMQITDFVAIQQALIIAGTVANRPAAFLYDLKAKQLLTLEQINAPKGEILEVKVNMDKKSFNVLFSTLDRKNDLTVHVNTYGHQGTFIRDYQLDTEPFYQLTNAVSSSINNIEQVVVGLYHYKKGTDPSGYYVNHIDKTGQQRMKYLPFGAFVSFFAHEGKEKAKRLKERSIAGNNSEKPFRYNVEAIVNPILEQDGKLIINTQFFKPRNYVMADGVISKGGKVPRNTWRASSIHALSNNTGVEFTHSFTFSVDLKGELIWDLNTAINTAQKGGLSAFGQFSDDVNNLLFAHYYAEELYIHELRTSKTFFDIALPLLDENDELKFESPTFGGLLPWKNNRFVIYGIQHVGDQQNPKNKREVYFVNGIRFIPQYLSN